MMLRILAGLALLGAVVQPAAAETTYPFIGEWDCGVATFIFTPTVYYNGSEDLPIEEAQEGSDGSWTLLFADDYAITLSGFTGSEMSWLSLASGDSFDCRRTSAGAETEAGLPSTTGHSYGGVLRAGPGTEHPRRASLLNSDAIEVLEDTGVWFNGYKWFRVRTPRGEGFHWGGIFCLDEPAEGVFGHCGVTTF